MTPRSLLLRYLPLLAALFLSSCAVGIFTRSVFGETFDIDLKVNEIANNEVPLAMDLVYVYDEDLLKDFLQMSARQWFEKKEDLRNNDPGEDGFSTFAWEWTPGADTTLNVPLKSGTVGGIIFVNYFTEGQHRVRVDLFHDVTVTLGFDQFTVVPE